MKRVIIITSMLIFGGLGLQAQDNLDQRPERNQTEKRADREAQVKQDLGLSEVQATEWDQIHEQFRSRARVIRNSEELDADAKKAKIGAAKKTKNERIDALLSPEQQTKWEALKKEKRARKPGGKHHPKK